MMVDNNIYNKNKNNTLLHQTKIKNLRLVCLKCHSVALEKTYLTAFENFHSRLLAIFHTNSGLF